MMFGYEVNEHVTLKILEERGAEQLFKLVDSNRDYLGEFLPFVEYTTEVAHSKFIQSALEQFTRCDGFHCGIWYDDELVGVIGLHYLDLVNKRTSIGYYWLNIFRKRES